MEKVKWYQRVSAKSEKYVTTDLNIIFKNYFITHVE